MPGPDLELGTSRRCFACAEFDDNRNLAKTDAIEHECSICHKKLRKALFSNNQLNIMSTDRRCNACVESQRANHCEIDEAPVLCLVCRQPFFDASWSYTERKDIRRGHKKVVCGGCQQRGFHSGKGGAEKYPCGKCVQQLGCNLFDRSELAAWRKRVHKPKLLCYKCQPRESQAPRKQKKKGNADPVC